MLETEIATYQAVADVAQMQAQLSDILEAKLVAD